MPDAFLTYQQAADMLDLSVDGVRALVRKNILPVVRLGHRTVRIKRSDLDAVPTTYHHEAQEAKP
jgi:excisionase family DNA binding protein